jgi:hypothetical protein
MAISINIHPTKEKWEIVEAFLFDEKAGNCIYLTLDENAICLHYGSLKNQNEFITKLKETINKLPNKCDHCGQEIR